jgi:hypothetical protein
LARPCLICSRRDRREIDALIASGVSDREVGRRFGIEHVSVNRHRRRHLVPETQARHAILTRDSDAKREREQLISAAASSDLSPKQQVDALFGLQRLSERLQAIEARLERSAERAENDGAHTAVAQLAGQQLREVELRGRLGGHLGPRPADGAPTTMFNLVINVPDRGRPFTIAVPAPLGDEAFDVDDPDAAS